MQSLDEHITIPGNTSTRNDLDFEFLREKGQEYIEALGRKLWTDYNIHDPGITIMELLCYAITDLGLRLDLNMEDILASKDQNFMEMHKQFKSAAQILTCKPVTANDYRKLFIDLEGVKNVWLLPFHLTLHLECDPEKPVLSFKPLIGSTNKSTQFDIRGEILPDCPKDLCMDIFFINSRFKLEGSTNPDTMSRDFFYFC